MSYDSNRIKEQLRVLKPEINNFITRYNASGGPAGGGPRQTVFLFPGGMGSRLVRAKKKWDSKGPAHQIFDYDEFWLNALMFLGRARDLRMTKAGAHDYRDKNERIIVADGTINLFGWSPYVDFTKWCALKGLDYFVFPCDWRRAAYDLGDLFIHHFLPYFQRLVKAGCNNADPLARFSLIGHSAGGMVVNWALRSGALIMTGLDKAITVATPFYGYSGQLHRWFEGEDYLNGLGVFKKGIIEAICSFPGCYEWMFLPHGVFQTAQPALCADSVYPLCVYPSVDRTSGAIADPYNPQTNGPKRRYPTAANEGGFDLVELACARMLVTFLASSLAQGQADKFWNIRGDTAAAETLHDTTWDWVPPTNPSPIRDGLSNVHGDTVQPGWTARHVGLEPLAPGHVITVKSKHAEHMTLMDLPETLDRIAGILGIPV